MAQKGDFIGFTFNDTHSSDLGIVRTSNGSRYNSNLLPSSQDQTVAVPGGDGVYFFGTNYQTRVFQLQIASDEISETQLRQIQQIWGDKQIHELIFDETPYKVYMAKCTNMPQFNFICFDENNQRVYKGEGSVEFTCYYPYAKSRYKFLNEYTHKDENDRYDNVPEWNSNEVVLGDQMFHNHHLLGNDHIDIDASMVDLCNIDEWSAASGMLAEKGIFDTPRTSAQDHIKLSEEAEYDDEEQYYTYEKVSHEQINPHEEYSGFTISLINIDDWKDTSGMLDTQEGTVVVDTPYPTAVGEVDNAAIIYNPGDIEADFQILFTPVSNMQIILYEDTESPIYQLNLEGITLIGNDTYIQYDSKTELLTGYKTLNTPSSHLYNKYIKSGDFFKIPIIKGINTYHILITNDSVLQSINYDYLYY